MKDLLVQVEQLLAGKSEADLRSWCQVHESQAQGAGPNGSNGSTDSPESDLEKLKTSIANRLSSTGSKSAAVDLQIASPSSCVIVSASSFEETESKEEAEKSLPDLAAMNFFSQDAAAQLEEAHRLGGLLRLQWHFAVVKATRESKDDKDSKDQSRPLALGIGFATDEALSKARALRAAEVRAEVLTEAMFLKTQK